jgi:hypothetical protein
LYLHSWPPPQVRDFAFIFTLKDPTHKYCPLLIIV